jgi:hypothetical protein
MWSDDTSIGPGMYFYNDDNLPWDIFRVDYGAKDGTTSNSEWDSDQTHVLYPQHHHFIANSFDNKNLFQIFSSEIDFRRDDVMSVLK